MMIFGHQIKGYISDTVTFTRETMMEKANETEWQARAKNILKAELKRKGVSYAQLVVKLGPLGVEETERNIANKISRGGFTAVFFLQCLIAIDCHNLSLDL